MLEDALADWKDPVRPAGIRLQIRSFRPVLLASGLAALCLAGSVAAAEPPRMLADLATGLPRYTPYFPQPEGFLDVGGITVFADSDPDGFRSSLWRTDGTAAGTRLLRVFTPFGGGTRAIGTAKGRAYYSSGGGDDGVTYWVTDGTPQGTALLTPQPIPGGGGPAAVSDEGLLFTVCEGWPTSGCSFWSSDGTVEGTVRRGAIQADGGKIAPLQLVALERIGLQLFRRGEAVDLLAIDPAGGVEVLQRFPVTVPPSLLTAAGNRAFFLAPVDGVGGHLQLWTSDGTPGGTRALTGFTGSQAFDATDFLRPIGGSLYFLADDGSHGVELWAHDGGPGNGRQVTDFTPPQPFQKYYGDGLPGSMLGRIGNTIVFPADGGDGWRLWTTRGTLASTQPLRGCPAGCPGARAGYYNLADFARAGDRLVFAAYDPQHGRELWTTDGTGTGTFLLADLTPGPASLSARIFTTAGRFAVFQNFTEEYDEYNAELWVTDGTTAGTHRLAYGGPGASHYFEPPHPRLDVGAPGSRVVIRAFDHDGRQGLWASDGSAAGTGPLRAEHPGIGSDPTDFAWLGDRLLTQINRYIDPALVALGAGAPEPLLGWTAHLPVLTAGRAAVQAYTPRDPTDTLGDVFYEVWGTDGTPSGTQRLLGEPQLYPAALFPSARWGALILGYKEDDDGMGPMLGEPVTIYRTDATAAGTRPLLKLPRGLNPHDPVEIGGRIYFLAYEYDRKGFRVWSSDGTAAGTVPLFADSTANLHNPSFTKFGRAVVFLALGTDRSVSLWRTAGTPETTQRIVRLADYDLFNERQDWSFEVAGGKIYFWGPASPDVIGPLRPWVSDGTAAGTRQLADVAPDRPLGLYWGVRTFVAAGTKVFFAAHDGIHGNELWSTDGTPGGTALAADVWPGPMSSDPRQLTALGGELAFVAQTPLAGAELRLFAPCTGRKFRTVFDLALGPSWSEPAELLWDSSRAVLVFSASDGLHGREPWEWRPGDTLGACSPSR